MPPNVRDLAQAMSSLEDAVRGTPSESAFLQVAMALRGPLNQIRRETDRSRSAQGARDRLRHDMMSWVMEESQQSDNPDGALQSIARVQERIYENVQSSKVECLEVLRSHPSLFEGTPFYRIVDVSEARIAYLSTNYTPLAIVSGTPWRTIYGPLTGALIQDAQKAWESEYSVWQCMHHLTSSLETPTLWDHLE